MTSDFFVRELSIHHLTLWQRVDDTRRIGSDGRRQVYLHAAGCAPVPLGQVRPDKASELQIHRRRRQEVPL